MTTLWHYTTKVHLAQIITSRHLRLTPRVPLPGQVQGVWFTESECWEPTAAKRVKLRDPEGREEVNLGLTTFDELQSYMGIARVGVDDGPEYLTFQQYERVCSPEWARHLVGAAIDMAREVKWEGNCGPGWWRVCLREVGSLKFKQIQTYEKGEWRSYG